MPIFFLFSTGQRFARSAPAGCTGILGRFSLLLSVKYCIMHYLLILFFVYFLPVLSPAVERLLLEQVGELQLKMDHVIQLLQKNNPIPHEDFNLNMIPLLTLQDLENFEDKLRTDSTFKKKVVCPVCVYL